MRLANKNKQGSIDNEEKLPFDVDNDNDLNNENKQSSVGSLNNCKHKPSLNNDKVSSLSSDESIKQEPVKICAVI